MVRFVGQPVNISPPCHGHSFHPRRLKFGVEANWLKVAVVMGGA